MLLKQLNSSFTMKDSVGETFRIEVKENVENRTVLLYDSDGDIIQTLIFNKHTGVLTNPDNGAELINLDYAEKGLSSCNSMRSGKDYEYQFVRWVKVIHLQMRLLSEK